MSQHVSPTEMGTGSIIRRSQMGSRTAQNELALRCQGYLRRLLQRKHVNEIEAEDCTQETLQRLFAELDGQRLTYRTPGEFRGWLKTVVNRVLVDSMRRAGSWWRTAQALPANVADDRQDLSHLVQQCHEREVLHLACEAARPHFEPRTYQCFHYRYVEGLEIADVACLLSLTPAAVYKNAARVCERVREELQRIERSAE